MKRIIEWLFTAIGAILCIGGAISIWGLQASSNPPGVSMWPMPALILIEIALLGTMGLLGIVYEPNRSASRWAILTWIACGGLMGLGILGEFTVSAIVFLVVPALFFGGAAILADIIRKRKMLSDLGVLILSGIVTFGLLFTFLILG
ncbi:MAG: hypothetical protein ABSG01_04795 [Anaerolineales bacterium]